MKYDVYIQDNLVGNVDADNTGNALAVIAKKIDNGEFVVDKSKPANIKVVPSNG